jgi:hypothetical protein
MTATAVFLPPLTRTSPISGLPPVMSILSFVGMTASCFGKAHDAAPRRNLRESVNTEIISCNVKKPSGYT